MYVQRNCWGFILRDVQFSLLTRHDKKQAGVSFFWNELWSRLHNKDKNVSSKTGPVENHYISRSSVCIFYVKFLFIILIYRQYLSYLYFFLNSHLCSFQNAPVACFLEVWLNSGYCSMRPHPIS